MPAKFKRNISKWWKKLSLPLLLTLIALSLFGIIIILSPLFRFTKENKLGPTFLFSLLLNRNSSFKNYQDRTNLLLLGIPGGNHQGSDLTDTMIFLSLNLQNKEIIMLSLPRDVWSPTLKDKINSAYHYGEEKKVGGGLILAKSIGEEVLGQPIHYAVLIDFLGFKRIIDFLGGIDIEIERSFDDYKFPISGKENDLCEGDPEFKCRYEHIHFEKGKKLLNGEEALKYVRSRNAEGGEGTDFARSQRQQKLTLALKERVLSIKTLLDWPKTRKLIELLGETVNADMKLSEILFLGRKMAGLKKEGMRTIVLEVEDEEKGAEGFLINPPVWEYGKWVLVPKTGNFEKIHQYVECQIKSSDCPLEP